MANASWAKSPADLVERFAAALPDHPALTRRPMFGYPAAFAHGNMVCGLFQDTVVVRLGAQGAGEAIATEGALPFTPMPGRTMTGYVTVPVAAAATNPQLAAWLKRALDFTLTLPAKPSSPVTKPSSSASKPSSPASKPRATASTAKKRR